MNVQNEIRSKREKKSRSHLIEWASEIEDEELPHHRHLQAIINYLFYTTTVTVCSLASSYTLMGERKIVELFCLIMDVVTIVFRLLNFKILSDASENNLKIKYIPKINFLMIINIEFSLFAPLISSVYLFFILPTSYHSECGE